MRDFQENDPGIAAHLAFQPRHLIGHLDYPQPIILKLGTTRTFRPEEETRSYIMVVQ